MVLQSRNWCFTWNNYTDKSIDVLKALFDSGEAEYLVFGKEVAPSTGTAHLQGCVRFKKKKRMKGVKNQINSDAHFEVVNNMEAMIEYCKKDGDFEEYGEYHVVQGKRTDIDKIVSMVLEDGLIDMDIWLTEYPNMYCAHKSFIQDLIEKYHRNNAPVVESHPLKKWQVSLWRTLEGDIHPRKIIFVVDRRGGTGKSWFAKLYQNHHDKTTDVMKPSEYKNLAFLYKRETRVFFLDVPLSDSGIDYSFLEQVKDGQVTSTKYMPMNKRFACPHIVVMTNIKPDHNMLIHDRFCVFEISDDNNKIEEGFLGENLYTSYGYDY